MPYLQKRIQQINALEEKDARPLLKVIYSQLEINKKATVNFNPNEFAQDIRSLLDEYSEDEIKS
ncbi:hypothetical protein [Alkalicoccobacillus porphyridii]|uniref:Uncharacterized protein n=1 Tax=Alkalicoccobacillus porphyridii TaxID=2597270 RepID=A0A554A3F3_9BACI|nr:hypothetical protein [Alkalicoccobacillus porphyridii]TSB48176.1 hypothetical protein FN960_01065 [Alkalicoccobacillus porphyridii]